LHLVGHFKRIVLSCTEPWLSNKNPTSAKAKNERSCTSTLPICRHGVDSGNFKFHCLRIRHIQMKGTQQEGDGLCFKLSRFQYPIFFLCSIPLVSNKVNTYSVSRISAPYYTTDCLSPLLVIAVFAVTCTPKENWNPSYSVLPSKHSDTNGFRWSKWREIDIRSH